MNKILRFSFVALMAMMFGNVMADEVTIDFTAKGYTNAQEITTVEQDGISLTFDAGTNKNAPKYYTTGTAVRCYGGNSITVASSGKSISKIEFTFASGEGTNTIVPSVGVINGTAWTGSAQNLTLTIDGTSGHRRIQKMVFTLSDGTSTTKATTISFSDGYQTQIAKGPDDMFPEIGSSVALPTATVMADGEAVAGANVEWSLEVKSWKEKREGEQPILENGRISFEGYGVVSVKATFAGNDAYQASSKNYTLTIYNSYGKLSEMVNDVIDITGEKDDEDDKDGSPVFFFFRDIDTDGFPPLICTVTYVNGKNIYLTDGDGNNLLFYGDNTQELKQGDKISGNVGEANLGGFWGNLKRYNKLPEFVFTDMKVKVESEGNAVEPKTITVDKLAENINAYVKIENAQLASVNKKNLVFKVGDANLAVYNQFGVDIEALELGATYTVTGMGSVYNTTKQLNLIEFIKTADAPAHVNTISVMKKNGAIYNLAGQRVQTMSRGLYIKDGKKFIVK
jgi:hypothetical protein